jgi:signal transduction histidine kinase
LFGVSYIQNQSRTESLVESFEANSRKALRRIESEIAVGNKAAAPRIAHSFVNEHPSIDKIYLDVAMPAECEGKQSCLLQQSAKSLHYYKVESKTDPTVLLAEVALPTIWEDFNIAEAWWLLLFVVTLTLAGIMIQRLINQKYVIGPISNLLRDGEANTDIPDHYPVEIERLANELNESIKARDQVIIGQLASGVIHDLKTQIQSITSALALVKESESNPETKAKATNMLLRASERNLPRMLKIIETTLDGSRTLELAPKPTSLKNTIEESIEDCRDLAKARNVEIDYSEIGTKNLNFDSVQMERVFSNLVKNAIEAFDEEGFSSPFRKIRISTKDLDSHVEVNVEDSGPGLKISSKDIFRLSQTTKPTGAGLGLLVSRRIVEAHNGRIEAGKSAGLQGARFTVVLPVGGAQ